MFQNFLDRRADGYIPRYIYEIRHSLYLWITPYMLLDVPKVRTYINGYTPSRYVIDAIVEKIMGEAGLQGKIRWIRFAGCSNPALKTA